MSELILCYIGDDLQYGQGGLLSIGFCGIPLFVIRVNTSHDLPAIRRSGANKSLPYERLDLLADAVCAALILLA